MTTPNANPTFILLNTLLAFLVLIGLTSGISAAPAKTQREVTHLLAYLESSGCDFHRNGSWHKAKQARAHLEKKYHYLDKRALIGSADDFISRAASASSMSGEVYLVKCPNGKAVSSSSWLGAELQRYRARSAQ